MSESAIVEQTEVSEMLEGLCARNSAGEVHYDLSSENIRTARFRFLTVDSEALCIDQPHNIDQAVTLSSGQAVTVYFTHENDRWSFESRVDRLRRIVRLNDKKRIVGMSLARPYELKVQQRRRDYRVGIASLGRRCRMTFESKRSPLACDLGAEVLDCSIRDISARGMALVIHPDEPLRVKHGTRVFLEFSVEDSGETNVCLAELCHVEQLGADKKQLWGMRLVPTPGVDFEDFQADLAHFVADEQRKKLRRRR